MAKSKKKSKLKKYKDATKEVLEEFKDGFKQFGVKTKIVRDRTVKMLVMLYEVQRKDMYFSGHAIVKLCLHFVLHLPSDYS